ncbi:MAG: DnaA ATPase domain-containing protein, partial [bacterium]
MPLDENLWKSALDYIYARRNDPILRAFIAEASLERKDNILTLFVHNELVLNILRSRYYTLIVEALEKASGIEQLQLDFQVQQPPVEKTHQLALFQSDIERKTAPNLNSNFTFATFVVGETNRMTHAAALAVSQNPGRTYNPLFIYGGVGLGKTHLLHSIGHCLLEFPAPDFDLRYTTAENFTNEFITSLQEKRMNDFRHKYRACDALLIDDIQFLAQKTETQEAFFHIFNTLIESDRQIVLTSDRSPRELRDIEERLVSRFSAGLITDVQPPD